MTFKLLLYFLRWSEDYDKKNFILYNEFSGFGVW
jgi:hypothetical protein